MTFRNMLGRKGCCWLFRCNSYWWNWRRNFRKSLQKKQKLQYYAITHSYTCYNEKGKVKPYLTGMVSFKVAQQ